ncbi:hypothetical protein LB507_004847 [Fusarium sp. FIESC RH6]|nr:hypothetical protein LB507_004847 [Fusarium sp. FIESC RH6]
MPFEHQALITHWMTNHLEQLLESETGILLPEFADEEETSQPDVLILAEVPHVIPYPLFQQKCMSIIEEYDPWRYPDNIKDLHHKKTWRAPEELEGDIAAQLLSKYEPLWPASLAPPGVEKLGELTNCQISHDLQGTLFYLGSDDTANALDVATRKLNTLASFLDAPSATTSHLVFTESLDQTKLCYQWVTQLGISTLTYVYPECADLEDEYKRLAGAVTLRNGITNPKGQLIPDPTTYPIGDQAPVSKQPEFRPFERYAYSNKRSGTSAARDKRATKTSLAYLPRVPRGRTSGKVSFQDHTVNRWLGTIKPNEPPQKPNGLEEYENEKPGGFKETNELIEVDGTDDNCPEEPDIFQGLSRSSMLVPVDGQQNQAIRLGQQIVASSTRNLMDISDDPINIPVLQPVSSEVIFGKRNDEGKVLHQTMKQKASNDPSWARIAAKNSRNQKQDPTNFGSNVRVKSDRPFAAKPTTTKPVSEEKLRAPTVTQGNDECARILHEAEKKLQELVKVLQVVPGHISIQAKFGRLCVKGIPAAEVYMNPTPYGPFNTVGTVVKSLNDAKPPVEFSPILTTSAAEANLISMVPGGRTSWVLVGKRVFYEFVCVQEVYISGEAEPHCHENRLVVNVDAGDFTHECLPLTHEVSRAFVHCTRRAWDIQLCISQRDTTQVTEEFQKFAASLVRSMDIETNEIGEVVIQVEPESATGWHIERTRICHEATYRNGAKGPSCLTTTMFRVVERIPGTAKGLYRGQSVPVALLSHGQIGQWYEASISSIKAEDVLQENVGLELGEQTSWSTDEMKRLGAFKAVCEPAIRMVRQMDKVGNTNENGHGTQTDQPPFDAIQYLEDKEKKYSYW